MSDKISDKPESLHCLKAKMTAEKGRITRDIKKIKTACTELVNEEAAPTLMTDRLAEDTLENRKKVKKEIKNTEDIAALLTDAIASSAKPNEV